MMKTDVSYGLAVRFILNRWLWLVLLILWGGLNLFSLRDGISTIKQQHTEIAVDNARTIFRLVQLTRLWNARHGGVYVPITPQTQPNPYLDIPDREIETTSGKRLTKINPAFMTRQLSDLITPNGGVTFHITSLNPIRPANKADPWESAALNRFEVGTDEVFERVTDQESDHFRYMAPLVVKKPCMKCHEKQGYEIGDIRGGISVTLFAEPIFGKSAHSIEHEVNNHLLVFVIGCLILVLFLEKVRRQWLALEKVEREQELVIKERTRELEHLATHDSLTGIYNRNALEALLKSEHDRAKRYRHALSFIMFDLDHFKQVNDQYGHLAGDLVLAHVASTAAKLIRKSDVLARYGGEEFIVLLPESLHQSAMEMAERLRREIESQKIPIDDGRIISVTTSVGVACYPEDSDGSIDHLLSRADEAMYAAKHQGRNCVVAYSSLQD